MHHIVASPAINMIDVKLSGFLTTQDVQAISEDFRGLFAAGKAKPGYRLLVDIGACTIQSQDVMGAFVTLVVGMPKAQRIAVVCKSSMVELQLKRVMNQPYMRCVPDRQAALAWLTREIEPSIAA